MLNVPYVSQIQPGALIHNNDCGAASVLMVLKAYCLGKETVDQIYDKINPSGDMPLSASGLQRILLANGITSEWHAGMAIHDMYDVLVARRPIIALVHYAPLVKAGLTEKTGFQGAHFIVVIGMDIESIWIHDPYSTEKGNMLQVPVAVFEQAWIQCNLDGNPVNAGLLIAIAIQDLSTPVLAPTGTKYQFTVHNGTLINGINVRSGPGDYYPVVKTLWRTDSPYVFITRISGDRGLLVDGSGWVYMPYIAKV